jgi:uncharacterized membrane protein HdeD (DUF308 family)
MTMETSLDWRSAGVRGVAALAFGVLTLLWPGLTLTVLVILFGAYALVDGVTHLIAAFAGHRSGGDRTVLVLEGLLGVAAGLVTLVWPGITALALLFVIAAWAIVTGVLRIAAAVRLRGVAAHDWLLGVSGALSVVFGIVLAAAPVAGALAITWLIGFYALVFGFLLLGVAWRLRKSGGRIEVRVRGPVREAAA